MIRMSVSFQVLQPVIARVIGYQVLFLPRNASDRSVLLGMASYRWG